MAISALVSASRTLGSLYMLGITAFVAPVITVEDLSWIKLLLVWCLLLIAFTWVPTFFDLDWWLNCFHLDLFGGISVLWCLSRFTWVACSSLDICLICLAVNLEDSSFLASCLTLLAGNFSRSILESLIVLETKFLIPQKKPKYSCTALYHSSTEQSPCLKVVIRSNLALTSFVCGLQNSLHFVQMTSKHKSSGVKHQDIYWSLLKSPDQATIFLHF